MTKIVYSPRYDGFSLSHEAIMRYAEIKGITLYTAESDAVLAIKTYWMVPPAEQEALQEADRNFYTMSQEDRVKHGEAWKRSTLNDRDIPRTDPALVQVVEELGEKASGRFAHLVIHELPEGTRYRIEEYDGNESIETEHDIVWEVA